MIESSLLVSVLWTAGVFMQALLLPRGPWTKFEWVKFFICVTAWAAGFIPGREEWIYEPYTHVFLASLGFTLFYTIFFRNRILPRISEFLVLVWNLLFLSVALPVAWPYPALLAGVLLPSAAILTMACMSVPNNKFWKVFSYIWFLFMVACIGVAQWKMGSIWQFFDETTPMRMPAAEAFFGGMALLSIGTYAFYLFSLLPFQGRGQSWESRKKQLAEEMKFMEGSVDDDQLRLPVVTAIVLLLGGALLGNFYRPLVPNLLLVNAAIVLAPFFLNMRKGTPPMELAGSGGAQPSGKK